MDSKIALNEGGLYYITVIIYCKTIYYIKIKFNYRITMANLSILKNGKAKAVR